MTDLRTRYLGLDLAHPVVASSSPLTGTIDGLHALAEAGAAAVVLPSLFEEQVEHEAFALQSAVEIGPAITAEVVDGWLPDLAEPGGAEQTTVELVAAARRELSVPVIASVNGSSDGGWVDHATSLQDAGAHALELNVYHVAADVDVAGAEVEERYLRLVEHVRSAVEVPLAVKVGPWFSSPGNMVARLADAGADAVVIFNRFYQPDIDLETLEVVPDLVLSDPHELRLVLRWTAILAGRVDVELAATTGVHSADDVVKLVLAGATVAMTTSSLLLHGPGHLRNLVQGTRRWFTERGYDSLDQARGSLSQVAAPDPSAFERANYMKALVSYAPR